MNRWPRRRAWWMALLALLIGLAGAPLVRADVEGNTYTSPQFGFTWTWDDSWFLVSEDSDPAFGDSVEITNGVTTALIIAGTDFGDDAPFTLEILYRSFGRQEGVTSVTRVEDSQVLAEGRASEVFVIAFEATGAAPSQEITIYIDVRVMGPGMPVAIFEAFTTSDRFPREWPGIEKLLNGWSVVSGQTPAVDGTPDDPGDGSPVAAEEPGEPAPVFVAGQWRIAVRAAALAGRFSDLGLRRREDNEWLVIVADVTNWSDEDGTFAAGDLTVAVEGEDPIEPAEGQTGNVAEDLGLGPDPDSLEQEIAAGETARVALVFLVPAGSDGLALQAGDEGLPLEGVLGDELNPDGLPEEVNAPSVLAGELVSSSDGRTVRIQLEGDTGSSRVRLLGVALPAEGACFAGEAASLLESLEGAPVLIERDDVATGGSGSERYVWIVNEDGTRTLLNAQVIRAGLATAEVLPDDARFDAWLQESERRAKEEPAGLWAECDQPIEERPDGDATPEGDAAADVAAAGEADDEGSGIGNGPAGQIGSNPRATATGEAAEDATPAPEA